MPACLPDACSPLGEAEGLLAGIEENCLKLLLPTATGHLISKAWIYNTAVDRTKCVTQSY